MTRFFARLILVTAIIAVALPVFALDVPALKGHVNDYAGMFKPATVAMLESELADFESKESTQIVVLTVPSLKGEVMEEFSMKVAEKWRIGQKKLDNGVILTISKQDRKIRIEVGYGLEGRLTDLLSGRIIDNDIKPAFKAGQYDEGILVAARSIEKAVKGEYPGMASDPNIEKPFWTESAIIVTCVLGGLGLIILIIIILARKYPAAFASSGGSSYSSGSSDNSSSYSSSSSSSSDSSSSSSSSDSYSGGGGSYGGGGASGEW